MRIVRKSLITKLPKAPAKIENKKIALPKFNKEKKKMGRPSLAKQIIEAYEALKKDGQIDYEVSQMSHVEAVRQAVWVLYPELKNSKGLEDEAIRNKIGPLFNAEKDAQKVTQKL